MCKLKIVMAADNDCLNEHEAALLTGSFLRVDEKDGVQEKDLLYTAVSLHAQGASNVIITLGGNGSALYTEDGICYVPCVNAHVR
ncbi:MAG: hypothetical protein KH704_12870 [Clostridiales bacterium]|nr:hypothetical protein [Clostridiales bacterium]